MERGHYWGKRILTPPQPWARTVTAEFCSERDFSFHLTWLETAGQSEGSSNFSSDAEGKNVWPDLTISHYPDWFHGGNNFVRKPQAADVHGDTIIMYIQIVLPLPLTMTTLLV